MRIAVWNDGRWCWMNAIAAFRVQHPDLDDNYSTHFAANDRQAELVAERVEQHAQGATL